MSGSASGSVSSYFPIAVPYDVVVIGGDVGGLASSLALGRANRPTLCIDNETYRNAPATNIHNVVCHDGQPPVEFRSLARKDVLKYSSVKFARATVTQIVSLDEKLLGSLREEERNALKQQWQGYHFLLLLSDPAANSPCVAKRIILATGIRDQVPNIPGLSELWGAGLHHCPYCHGYELTCDLPWGTLAICSNEPDMMKINGDYLYQGIQMFGSFPRHLTYPQPMKPLVIFTHGVEPSKIFSPQQLDKIRANKAQFVTERITSCVGTGKDRNGCQSVEVHLESGNTVHVASLFYRCPFKQSEIVKQVPNLQFNDKNAIKVTGLGKTTNNYVFAAGDCSETGSILPMAMGNGALAGGLGCSNHLGAEEWESAQL